MGATGQSGPGASVIQHRMNVLGCLSFLAARCDLHSRLPLRVLDAIFMPAVEHGCVRLFNNDAGLPCAALIWAKLGDDTSRRMVFEGRLPSGDEWNGGANLWFLDLLAPFGHGQQIAKHIARNPPDGPFYFARLNDAGRIGRVVEGNALRARGNRLRAFAV